MDDLISRQAAITAIQNAYCDTDGGEDKCAVWKNVGLTEALHIMQDLPSAQRWIPCGERLPEPGVNVLVHVLDIPAGDCFPLVDKIGDNGDWCNCYGEWLAVAWVPIPDPWEGENDG